MRLTFVLPFCSRRPIGGLRVAYEFANGLAARGHSVTVVHPRRLAGIPVLPGLRHAASRWVDRRANQRRVSWMPTHPGVTLAHVDDIADQRLPDADAIFATSWQTAGPVARLAAAKGRKHYLVMDFYPYLAERRVLEETWRMGLRMATISRWLARLVLDAGVNESDVAAVSCGVSAAHGLTRDPGEREPSVVMMYGLANYKAVEDGLEAIAEARRRVGPFPVRLFGANSWRRPRGLPKWTQYHALLPDERVSRLYNESAVFVSSSVAEGFCLPAAEAMASGCAIVATDCGGIRDFAVDSVNSLLSPPARPAELAANIVRALQDRALRLGLVSRGLATIPELSWPAAVGRLERFVAP